MLWKNYWLSGGIERVFRVKEEGWRLKYERYGRGELS
jgi:hypothetical protein